MKDALCDLVPFEQFKKREKHLSRSAVHSEIDLFESCSQLAKVSPYLLNVYVASALVAY